MGDMNTAIVGTGTKMKGIHPLEDREGHLKILFNDGKEVSKVISPYVYQSTVQQPSQAVQPQSPVMHSYVHCNNYTAIPNINQPLKLKFKVSKATRVVEPEPSTPEVILIDDDDDEEEENNDDKISKSLRQNCIGSTTRVCDWQCPQEQVQEDLFNLKLGDEPVYQQTSVDFIPKIQIEELKTSVQAQPCQEKKLLTQPTSEEEPFVDRSFEYGTQDTGVNLRVGDFQLESNLEELLNLMDDSNLDFDEPVTHTQIKEVKYQKGKVVYGEKTALLDLLDDIRSLKTGEHGVMCKDVYPTYQNQYECENIKKGIKGQYFVERNLGTGSYGVVQLCVDRSTRKEFVKKTIFKEFNKNEVAILLNLEHPNIVQLFGFMLKDGFPQVFMENAGTSLLHFTVGETTCNRLDNPTIWDLTKRGLSALEYLDNNGIIHFDIKPENLCIIDQGTALQLKLTDFGSAKTSTDPMDFKGWTAEYMAPELGRAFLRSKNPHMFVEDGRFLVCGKADVFAFALVTLFMFQKRHVLMHFFTNGKDSYKDVVNPDRVRLNIIFANVNDPETVLKLMISDKCSTDMKIILKGMLAGSPRDRLSASEARMKMEAMETPVIQQPSSPFGNSWSSFMGSENQISSTTRRMSVGGGQNSFSPSVLSSFGSNIGSPIGFPSSPGPVKMKIARKKQRRKVAEPYNNVNKNIDKDYNYKDLKPAENLDGNVPNFGLF